MDTDTLRRLHYAAAIACGVFAALVMHILLTVFGLGLDAVLRDAASGSKQQFISAMAWWAIGGIMSKTGNLGGTVDVIAGLAALGLALICAFCGARLAYLNAEQV